MTTTEPSDETRTWLAAAAFPGASELRLAAGGQVLETVFTVVQWTGVAWVAQQVLGHRGDSPWAALALLFCGGLLAAGAAWWVTQRQSAGRRQISMAIREKLVAGLLPAGSTRGESDAATATLAIVEMSDDVADHHAQALPRRLSAPASMTVIFVVTAVVQWPAAVILFLASLLIPLNMRLAGVFAREGAEARAEAGTRLAAVVLDSFRGMRTLQSIGAVQRRRLQLAAAAERLNATTMAVMRRAFLSGTVMEVVITFSIAANATYIGLSLLGYVRLPATPHVTLFTGMLALLLCPMYFAPLRSTAAAYHSRERALAAAPTIMPILAEPTPDHEVHSVATVAHSVAVVLDGVAFRCPGSHAAVIDDVSLTVQAGNWTAVTGPSGAGKTTLLSLIAGARQPSTGTVRWISPDAAVAPHLGSCAWIGQQTVILPGSVADNIRLGRPAASQADLQRAVIAAGLSGVIAGLPNGMDTELGPGGWGVSAGEARRIAIARAFLHDAGLWVLDEPTAHLDPHTENEVINALRNATKDRTVVIATHSAAVAGYADVVLTVADGTVDTAREKVPA